MDDSKPEGHDADCVAFHSHELSSDPNPNTITEVLPDKWEEHWNVNERSTAP